MTTTIFSQVSEVGVSLHKAVLESLVGRIEKAIEDGDIRSEGGMHSVLDFIKVVLNIPNASRTWSGFQDADPALVVHFGITKFTDRSNKETPVSDVAGLIYLAYMANCEYSKTLRRSSAALLAADYKAKFGGAPEVKEGDRPVSHFPIPLSYLHEASGIVKKSQVKDALFRNFNAFEHWVVGDDEQPWMTLATFSILILSFRSANGAKVELCPEIIKVESAEYFRYQRMRQNCRVGKRDGVAPGQMGFEF
jgi:hypothetical protein